ncbi:MAG: energy transducer TonB [Saprospiraceae bacterium]|nr:energy transducer TonB [Saprospiraceae bacterium]
MEKSKKSKDFLQQPVYPGGDKALTEFIYKNLKYPDAALEAGIEGIVMVEYDIDNKGKVVDTRVISGLGHGCDEEACRVLRLLKFDVGKNRGVRVVFHKKARIRFAKPVKQAAAPAPQTGFQANYIVTPAEPAAEPAAPASTTYTYTITLG